MSASRAAEFDLATKKTSIVSTATFLIFEPGLYTILFQAPTSGTTDVGMRLPCARLEPVPMEGGGQLSVSTIPAAGWISTSTAAAHVLVVGGRAGAVLTIYRNADAVTMPTVEFRALFKDGDRRQALAYTPPHEAAPQAEPPIKALVHFQELGDVMEERQGWVVDRSNQKPIEGFEFITPQLEPGELQYQGVMGQEWLTPWFEAGGYCGSRGLNLPILGYQLKLSGEAAERYQLSYSGVFAGRHEVGPITQGICEHDGDILTSMRVEMTERVASAEADPKPATRRERMMSRLMTSNERPAAAKPVKRK